MFPFESISIVSSAPTSSSAIECVLMMQTMSGNKEKKIISPSAPPPSAASVKLDHFGKLFRIFKGDGKGKGILIKNVLLVADCL